MALQHYQKKSLPVYKYQSRTDPAKYIPPPGLLDAFDVALELNMPLLLTGEPGCGKTQFAHHLGHHFDLPVEIFNAKTTSNASDLFYRYDAVRHFQYIQSLKHNPEGNEAQLSTHDFIRYTALGSAIKSAQKEGIRSIVLIDEIDKAPRDFPNDILNELESLEFSVIELREDFKAPDELRPIVILTSNSEKNLPAPFLRRCVFFNIAFPDNDHLFDILKKKLDYEESETTKLMQLIEEFEQIRGLAKQVNSKKPATAELIAWLVILNQLNFNVESLGTANVDKEALLKSYTVLAKSDELSIALEKRVNDWLKLT